MKTVGELKDGVAGLLSGTNVDKVTGLYKVFERAASKLVQKADIQEAVAKQAVTLYDGVYDYSISENIFGGAIVDLRPQGVSRVYQDTVEKKPVAVFDRVKGQLPSGYHVAFEWRKGTPIMRVTAEKPQASVILDGMSEDTGWTAAGSASALTEDATVFYDTPGSLRMTLTGASTGTLTKSITEVDLSTYEDVGVAFLAIRIPDGTTATNLTSIVLRLGSSDSAYDEVTATTGFLGAWTAGEWLLVAFDFSGATSTGTPDWSALDYVQVRIAHGATFTNFRVGGLFIALPSPHEVIYQTSAIFLVSGSQNKEITDDNDEIILSDASYILFEHECALGVAVQKEMEKKASVLRAVLYGGEGDETGGLYAQYRGDNPSQTVRTVGSYYDL